MARTEAEFKYAFAAWFRVAVRLVEREHGISAIDAARSEKPTLGKVIDRAIMRSAKILPDESDALRAEIAALRKRAEKAEAALRELAALKRMKEEADTLTAEDRAITAADLQSAMRLGAEYSSRKPAAWAAAFAIADRIDAARKEETWPTGHQQPEHHAAAKTKA